MSTTRRNAIIAAGVFGALGLTCLLIGLLAFALIPAALN